MSPNSSALAIYFTKQGHNGTIIDHTLAAVVPDRRFDAAPPQSATPCPVGMWGAFGAENKGWQGLAVINE